MNDRLVKELETLLQQAKDGKVDAVMVHAALEEDRTSAPGHLPDWKRIMSFTSGELVDVHSFICQLGPSLIPYMQQILAEIDAVTHGLTSRDRPPRQLHG